MANTFYNYLIFIDPASEISLNDLKVHLNLFYSKSNNTNAPQIILSESESKITIIFKDDYKFKIYLSDEPHVRMEAKEIAENNMNDWNDEPIDKEKLKICTRRFEVSGEPDYDMNYLNDSLFIIQTIEGSSEMIIFSEY